MTGTPDAVRALVDRAARVYDGAPGPAAQVRAVRDRLAEPIRVAVAGKVKAGKSTLLNALLGERIAATDAGECTMVTTWYRHGPAPSASLVLADGSREGLALRRASGGPPFDLGGRQPGEVAWVEVTWPLPILEQLTLIDTPGIGSLTREASQRTLDLVRTEGGTAGVDALVYLMRHRHAADLELLHGFHADTRTSALKDDAALNVIGVLSRADELGEQGIDAMLRAQELADTYARDPEVRQLCRGVLPVAGLLAQGAQTMTHDDFIAVLRFAELPKPRRDRLTLSASRFVGEDEPSLDAAARAALLERLGLFGVRLGAALVRMGFDTPAALAEELTRRSGLPALQEALRASYASSAELLKARSALQALTRIVAAHPRAGSAELEEALDEAFGSAADLRELHLLARLRRDGLPGLPDADVERAVRLLEWAAPGRAWTPRRRGETDPDLGAELGAWRGVANDPLLPHGTRQAAETLGRLCERFMSAPSG
nr:GTP-binding protein [Propionibacterium sp.]